MAKQKHELLRVLWLYTHSNLTTFIFFYEVHIGQLYCWQFPCRTLDFCSSSRVNINLLATLQFNVILICAMNSWLMQICWWNWWKLSLDKSEQTRMKRNVDHSCICKRIENYHYLPFYKVMPVFVGPSHYIPVINLNSQFLLWSYF